MTDCVDTIFEQEMVREDAVDVMLGSEYGDLIDLVEGIRPSILDAEKEDV